VWFGNITSNDCPSSYLFQVLACSYSLIANKNKIRTATDAVKDIPSGASLLVGGKKFFKSQERL
jgi:hypothetical protein